MTADLSIHVRVHGRVQQVAFREYTRREAQRLKVGGSAACTLESPHIPLALKGAIEGQLECVTSEAELTRVFQSVWRGYP